MSHEEATPGHGRSLPKAEATGSYAPLGAASELLRVLDQYLADLQGGKAPDRAKLLAEHPDLAGQLEECLAGIEFVHRAAKSPAGMPARLGDFRIVREIGRGGMGTVYEAEQLSLKRRVALKVLHLGIATDAEAMQRFHREAAAAGHLHHTNIVPIHAVGCEQGVHYYAMQFIEGQSLAAFVAKGQREFTPYSAERFQRLARWGLQAAEALAHAHQRGVIHRDIKPANLILDPEGTVWLTDFGLAKRADELTLTAAGVLMGTPRYMSPEQAAATRQPIDHRTDIYSLGATLYELATGRPVFESQTPQGVITQILNAEPVAPRLLQGRMPRDLETIILKCLAKEPGRRYQQAKDLADDLRAFLENRTIKARRPSLMERAVRWSRKKRGTGTVAAVAVAVSLLLLAGGLLGWSWYRQSRLGQVILSTGGPNLVAEILDDEDRVVVPNLSVPTKEPVSLPGGDYRLRLSGSGLLSETWPLEVPRGGEADHAVTLAPRWLWDPLEMKAGTRYELVDLVGRSDLLLFSAPERSVRRLGGVAGGSLWARDFVFDAKSLPAGEKLEEWLCFGDRPELVSASCDLNGDGVRDLVLASKGESPLLAALSGKDGSLLWHVRGRGDALPELPDWFNKGKVRVEAAGFGNVLGQPGLLDLEGEPVVVAAFGNNNIFYVNEKGNGIQQSVMWVEAFSARTGASRWKYKLGETGRERDKLGTVFVSGQPQPDIRPQMVTIDGRPVVAFTASAALTRLEAKTGREFQPLVDLQYEPARPMQIANVDASGQPAAVLLRDAMTGSLTIWRTPEGGGPPVESEIGPSPPVLSARSLRTGAVLWERPYAALRHFGGQLPDLRQTALLLNARNRDGGPVIVLPWVGESKRNSGDSPTSFSGLEMIDAASGQTLWQRRLWLTGSWRPPQEIMRPVVGPDLDGDGHREIFVAWVGEYFYRRPNNPPRYVCVEALSGADGHTLWRWRQELAPGNVHGEDSPLHWWQDGADGWPQLLVPVQNGPGGQAMTYVLSSATGRLAHTLPEVTEFQAADCSGDGIPDLVYRLPPQASARLVVLPGRPPPAWQVLESVHVARDFDGDHITDVLTWNNKQARSGRDGRKLWSKELPVAWGKNLLVLPPSADGAGSSTGADLVRLRGEGGPLVEAYSSNDLRRVWSSDRKGDGANSSMGLGGRQYRYPSLGWCRTREQGPTDFVFACQRTYHANGDRVAGFGVISGRDGSTRWETDVTLGGFDLDPRFGRFDVEDLNGNGWRDFVMWVPGQAPDGRNVARLQAFDGETGQPVWDKSPLEIPFFPPHGAFLWPRPVCFDWDGNGRPDVLVPMHSTTDAAHGRGVVQLFVLDGRTGVQKDLRRWRSSEFDSQMPLVVNFDGTGRKSLCLANLDSNNEAGIVFLRGGADPAPRVSLRHGHRDMVAGGWGCADLDGDGRDDVVYVNDGRLQARRGGDLQELWTWPLDGQPTKLLHLEPGGKEHPATVVVWRGRTIYGLDGRDAAIRWRCEADAPPPPDNGEEPAWGLLRTGDAGFLPRLLCPCDNAGTVCLQARPTSAAGTYLRGEPPPVSLAPVDQSWYRTLPWARQNDMYLGWYTLAPDGLFVVWLFYLGWRRRWWQLSAWTVGCLAITALWAVQLLSGDAPLEPEERYSWEGWYWIFYLSVGVSTVLMFLWVVFAGAFRLVRAACGLALAPSGMTPQRGRR
jgi:serine/threonine protein kinase